MPQENKNDKRPSMPKRKPKISAKQAARLDRNEALKAKGSTYFKKVYMNKKHKTKVYAKPRSDFPSS